jgi:Uma2 family endonuclease
LLVPNELIAGEITMNNLAIVEHYTVADFRQWEGDWELINGIPLAMAPSPNVQHQTLSMAIARQLDEALDDCPRCRALFEIDVELADDTVVRPDVLVICYEPEGERLTRPPSLVFEVVSPKTERRDEVAKFALYQAAGVAHYVLVYPQTKNARVFQLESGEFRKVGDFTEEAYRFELSHCMIDFDFSRLWRRK